MTKGQFYDEVKRRADTSEQKITASEVSRVLKVAFDYLGTMDAESMLQTIHSCIKKDPVPYTTKQE